MKDYESRLLTTPYAKPDVHGALAMPLYYTSAYEFPSAKAMADAFCGRSMAHSYSRISNPTVQHLERRVQAVTGAVSVTALNTGMAAIVHVLMNVVSEGANIVLPPHLFGNTVSFVRDTLGQLGVEARFVDFRSPEAVDAQIDERTCAIFFEVITNPQLYVFDIAALSSLAHAKGVPVVADTTIVPFSRFHAKEWGIDIEVVSSTKYISGGATGVGGLVLDYGTFNWAQGHTPALVQRARRTGPKLAFTARLKTELVTNLGALMQPQAAYMETLGLETLDLRFQRQASTALWLANELRNEPRIQRVNYTGLPDNPYYELSLRQFGPLPGAMLTIDLSDRDACFGFMDRLKVIRRATNLFDHKSLAIHPASTIFGLFTPEQRAEADVLDTTVRLSIGLESPEDLLADIRQAL